MLFGHFRGPRRRTAPTNADAPAFEYRAADLKRLQAELRAVFADGAERIVLDLDQLTDLDSAEVRGLITLLRRSREVGGDVALRVTRPALRRSLEMMALDRVFPLEPAA